MRAWCRCDYCPHRKEDEANGFDTTANASKLAPLIKSQGYDFVGRYLSKSTWKLITPAEPMRPLIAANFSRHGPMFGEIPHAARAEHEIVRLR